MVHGLNKLCVRAFFCEGGRGNSGQTWSGGQFLVSIAVLDGSGGGGVGEMGGGATKPSKTRFSDHFGNIIIVSLTDDTNAYLITYLFHDVILHNLYCKLPYVLFLLTYLLFCFQSLTY